jgi:glutathione S-transferase
MSSLPVLYSFRRCPYAIRARLALDVSGEACELREIVLRDKPEELLRASQKGTVPVLINTDGVVIDESLDIMLWTLRRNDPESWLSPERGSLEEMLSLIRRFDDEFKASLDRYKYPNRFPGASAELNRQAGSQFLLELEAHLQRTSHFFGDRAALADMALASFVRQFANVDAEWFAAQAWRKLHRWLSSIVDSPRFVRVMRPVNVWKPGCAGVVFPFAT